MSKGSKTRPLTVPKEQFNANWDAIFKKKKNKVLKLSGNMLTIPIEPAIAEPDFEIGSHPLPPLSVINAAIESAKK